MRRLKTALAEITVIRSQMARSVKLRGYNGGAVPDAGAAGLAGASP